MSSSVKPDLSIIILNYNVKDLLLNCLDSIFKNKTKEDNWQIIVVDNASKDGSVEAVKEKYGSPSTKFIPSEVEGLRVDLIENQSNLGFAQGNNAAIPKAKAPVILFLNPDTVVVNGAISKSLKFLMSNPDMGALTCRVELPDGRLDYSCHRGFPTPWNAFCYFSGLSKIFPHSSFFARYTASYLDTNKTHEIDCLTGAFLMVRTIAGEQINWWDKDYFWNGEDIEFCFSLKEKGWKIYFYPEVKIIHYKGSSSGLWNTAASRVSHQVRMTSATHAVSAMRIFYIKHYYKNYPPLLRDLILLGIKSLEHYRKFKIMMG
ncbi:glycosyltransferase family 2 protein [Candidatus Daviesbacteria bacterium]|nr:glycosyltransferase family 2 protein [Candidatus Daviesbacteria bacterium]